MRLDDGLFEFLHRPLMCIIAGVDRQGRPSAGRGIGLHVPDDRETMDVIFSAWQWPQLEAAIGETARLAVTFVSPADYVTFQIKGPARLRDAEDHDLAQSDKFIADATGALVSLGVPAEIIPPWLTTRGAKVARLDISEIYVQTPGPQAGLLASMRQP